MTTVAVPSNSESNTSLQELANATETHSHNITVSAVANATEKNQSQMFDSASSEDQAAVKKLLIAQRTELFSAANELNHHGKQLPTALWTSVAFPTCEIDHRSNSTWVTNATVPYFLSHCGEAWKVFLDSVADLFSQRIKDNENPVLDQTNIPVLVNFVHF